MPNFDAWRHIDGVKAAEDQHRENSSRLAHAYIRTDSTGWGEWAYPLPYVFGVRFIAKPFMAYGFDVDDNTDIVPTRFPRSCGFVYAWQVDSRGFYTGAYVAITVDDQGAFVTATASSPNYVLHHHFSFSGIAMKGVPDYLAQG